VSLRRGSPSATDAVNRVAFVNRKSSKRNLVEKSLKGECFDRHHPPQPTRRRSLCCHHSPHMQPRLACYSQLSPPS
jgi:hypothetical protein